jgi:mono/diheme cytochrome c family protein
VNMLGAPDGTLYIVDMYRGVVQEQIYWTDFLRDYVKARDLVEPVRLGRIWRLTHESTKRDRQPALSKATPAELVKTLSHPNGWWRDTAQQLLVQRNERSAVPELKQLARTAADWRTKLHALWTLDGLDAIEPDLVQQALRDRSPDVRASAIRLSERWISGSGHPLAASVLALRDDPSWTVRRQLAATVGELPDAQRLEPAVGLLTKFGSDPILVDAAISSLRGRELEALARMIPGTTASADPVSMLAAAVARSGAVESVQQVLARATDSSSPEAARFALLEGLESGLPGGGGGRGGRGLGGGRGAAPAKPVVLASEPTALAVLAAANGKLGGVAKKVIAKLEWPGKPAPKIEVAPLTDEEQQRFAAGAGLYKSLCLGCHQEDGRGKEKMAPTLVESPYTIGEPTAAMRILLAGKEGTTGLMPPLGGALSDEQIAAVLTYVRREWGNTGTPVAPADVTEIRGLTKTRNRPWTDAELTQGRGGRGGRGQ